MVVIVVAVRVEGESICLFDGWGRKKRKRCKGVGEERRYLKRVRRLIGRLCINPLRNLNFFFLFFFSSCLFGQGSSCATAFLFGCPRLGKP